MPVVSSQQSSEDDGDRGSAPQPGEVERILKLKVPVIVRLGEKKLPLSDVLQLAHGAILELGKSSDASLHLLVNNKVIGEGEAVKVGEHFGLRITGIGDVRQRVSALGG